MPRDLHCISSYKDFKNTQMQPVLSCEKLQLNYIFLFLALLGLKTGADIVHPLSLSKCKYAKKPFSLPTLESPETTEDMTSGPLKVLLCMHLHYFGDFIPLQQL